MLIAKKFIEKAGSFILFLLTMVLSTLGFFDVLGMELAGGLLRSPRMVMVISHRRSILYGNTVQLDGKDVSDNLSVMLLMHS